MKTLKYSLYLFLLINSIFFNTKGIPTQTDSTYRIESLSQNINTSYDEQNPMIDPTGNVLYFTRKNHPENSGGIKDPGDIWYANLDITGNWSMAKRLQSPVNNSGYNAIIGFSDNGNLMYLLNHYDASGSNAKTQGISVSKRVSGQWTFPKKINIDYFFNRSKEPSMRISEDGKILILSIESHDSHGAEDIYISFLNSDSQWTKPMNLGPVINTKFQEMTPYLSPDHMQLFFSSNGHGGFGSRDVFVSQRLDNTWKNWSNPENLGQGINSRGVELSYHVPVGEYAYFVSTMNSEGFGDIRRIKIPPPEQKENLVPDNLVDLELNEQIDSLSENDLTAVMPGGEKKNYSSIKFHGKVVDAEDLKKSVKALLSYQEIDDETLFQTTYSNDATGTYEINLKEGVSYLLTVSAEGYMSTEEIITATKTNAPSIQKYYLLTPLKVGTVVNLKNVLFERGTADLLSSSFDELDNVVEMMETNPNIAIELGGHTDNQGSGKLNLELSQRRVDMVKDYIIGKGIDPTRVFGRGYGGTQPIASNASEDTRQLNRRVEFKIIRD